MMLALWEYNLNWLPCSSYLVFVLFCFFCFNHHNYDCTVLHKTYHSASTQVSQLPELYKDSPASCTQWNNCNDTKKKHQNSSSGPSSWQNKQWLLKSDNNGLTGLHNSYPRVIAALRVLLELVYLWGSAPFVLYDRGIFEYFTKQ